MPLPRAASLTESVGASLRQKMIALVDSIAAVLEGSSVYVGLPAAGSAVGKDKAAVETAFNAAKTSTSGGTVAFGAGTYRVGDLALVWPTIPQIVTLEGAGQETTVLWFETDRAAGSFAMGGTGGYSVRARNMTIRGPGTSFTLGTAPANLRAVQCDNRAHLENVLIEGFYCGPQIIGDHVVLRRVKGQNNYYGLYLSDATTNGDNTIDSCDWTGNLRASIGVSPTGRMDAYTFLRGHVGYSPFGIEFEAGGAANWVGMVDSQFIGMGWEYCGNGFIYNSDRNVLAYNVEISGARPWTTNPAYKIAALAVQPDVYMGTLATWTIIGDGPTTWDCTTIRASTWHGYRLAYDRAVAAGKTFMRANMGLGGINGTFMLNNSNSRAVAMNVTAAVTVGQVVEYAGSRHYVRPHNPSAANGGSMIAGVTMTAATSGTDVCIVAIEEPEGMVVQVAGTGPYGANDMLFAVGTTGKVDNAAGAGVGYKDKAIVGRVGDTTVVNGGALAGVLVKVTDRAT